MAITITAYQVLSDGPRVVSENGTAVPWNPSNDMRRDGDLDNACILTFNLNPRANTGQLRILLNGADVVEPGGVPIQGRDRGMFITFPSQHASLGNNNFTFLHSGGADPVLEEIAIFYKRRVEGV